MSVAHKRCLPLLVGIAVLGVLLLATIALVGARRNHRSSPTVLKKTPSTLNVPELVDAAQLTHREERQRTYIDILKTKRVEARKAIMERLDATESYEEAQGLAQILRELDVASDADGDPP